MIEWNLGVLMLKALATHFAPRVGALVSRFPFLIIVASARRLAADSDGVSIVSNFGHIVFAKYRICLVNPAVNPRKISRLFSV